MIISAIVAVANDYTIGKNNDIPWYLPADLKYFKKVTLGHHIIMGRKCYQSIGRPLPKRTNIIITRNPYFIASNCIVKHSLEDALQLAQDNNEEEVFIIQNQTGKNGKWSSKIRIRQMKKIPTIIVLKSLKGKRRKAKFGRNK